MKKLTTKLIGACVVAALSTSVFADTIIGTYGNGKLTLKDAENNRKLIHLEGSAAEMGYQHGYLLAEQIKYTCSDEFFKEMMIGLLESQLSTAIPLIENDAVFDMLMGFMEDEVNKIMLYVTPDMKTEMNEIVNGAKARLDELNIDHGMISDKRIKMANLSFNLIFNKVYEYLVNTLYDSAIFGGGANSNGDGFVFTPEGTADGLSCISGHNLMQSHTIFGEKGLMFEYKPQYGNRFFAVGFPGAVGFATAMNDQGVSCGINAVASDYDHWNHNRYPYSSRGMSSLLLIRYIMESADTAQEAIDYIDNTAARGVPYIYVISGPEKGAAVEAGQTKHPLAVYNDLPNVDFGVRWPDNSQTTLYAEEQENDPTFVIATNIFLFQKVFFTCSHNCLNGPNYRYSFLLKKANEISASTDKMTIAKAKTLVSYLDPRETANPYWHEYLVPVSWEPGEKVGEYYSDTINMPGVLSVFDNGGKTVSVKYNKWASDWFTYQFPNDGYNNEKPWWKE